MSYIYLHNFYCDACAGDIKHTLHTANASYPRFVGNEKLYTPMDCANCGAFLENPLNEHGYEWVHNCIEQDLNSGRFDSIPVTVWASHYGIGIVAEIDILPKYVKNVVDTIGACRFKCVR